MKELLKSLDETRERIFKYFGTKDAGKAIDDFTDVYWKIDGSSCFYAKTPEEVDTDDGYIADFVDDPFLKESFTALSCWDMYGRDLRFTILDNSKEVK
jgi:hypothetical protein